MRFSDPQTSLLVRATNWLGDAVMTTPALAGVREAFPDARIVLLARPLVAELFRHHPDVDEVMVYELPGRHEGLFGRLRLAGELRRRRFDGALLLQNAFDAALIAFLGRVPERAGYPTDGRRILLTLPVPLTPGILERHEVEYYLCLLDGLGIPRPVPASLKLAVTGEEKEAMTARLALLGIERGAPVVAINPGATYGSAKRWYPERFAAVADHLIEDAGAQGLLFGSAGDRESTAEVGKNARHPLIDIAGKTNLKEAIALIARCRIFVSNDSGLMHVAGALGIPTIAIFGSTNPVTTSPVGEKSVVIHHDVDCSPCLKPVCPTDFRCMDLIGVEEVYTAARKLMESR